ncbi:hypothetical protein BWZ22_08380 [Seonamhaeicola sp. S2-3]|uniref:hypothetical protein n=1 Tax=Seonamhaeicola sp. S2-3 TaxID=1936081 RepID=UPI000972E432|nr:hypothetical protein [Seonamhaeicola sp. S2-3]APY11257.1 hypothetical protein BWZ22_08380 [Seonamhaeicola sp. S2-3]
MGNITSFIKSVVKACPYTLLGKKCVNVVKPNSAKQKASSSKAISLSKNIKTGRNIVLIGVFCPFFWFAILSGASKDFIILNAIHSGFVAVFGLLVMLVNYLRLHFYKQRIKRY